MLEINFTYVLTKFNTAEFKDRVYSKPKSVTLDQLENNIHREIKNVSVNTIPRVMQKIASLMQKVIRNKGAYIRHVM